MENFLEYGFHMLMVRPLPVYLSAVCAVGVLIAALFHSRGHLLVYLFLCRLNEQPVAQKASRKGGDGMEEIEKGQYSSDLLAKGAGPDEDAVCDVLVLEEFPALGENGSLLFLGALDDPAVGECRICMDVEPQGPHHPYDVHDIHICDEPGSPEWDFP